ncbi:MAG: cysteine desulfurase [Deltaproteobacteria bacterium]|nr:cysteine desulfurase [Deltaproteobacteria bacterium]
MAGPATHIYLDNAATTRTDPRVVEAVVRCLREDYGNASSLHRLGIAAEQALTAARAQVAAAIEATPVEIVFTSGGTEANGLAVLGAAGAARGRHAVASAVEHPSVLGSLKLLEEQGWEVTLVPVDADGRVDAEAVVAAVRGDTAVAARMLVQNEIGAVEPVAEVGALLRRAGSRCVFHVDAVQGLGKLPLSVRDLACDTLAVSAHKVHGPKGTGALYVRKGVRLRPLVGGGKQERGVRPGTENVPGCAGFGVAAALARAELPAAAARMAALRDRLVERVLAVEAGARLVGPPPGAHRACYSATLAFPRVPAEALLHALEARGVYVSSGSACASRQRGRSHVLRAIGLADHLETIRVTLSRETSEAEIDAAATAILAALGEIRA